MDRGIVLSLALDAVDPRLAEAKRSDAAEAALEMDLGMAVSLWSAMIYTILDGVGTAQGPQALDDLMRHFAALSLGLLELEAGG